MNHGSALRRFALVVALAMSPLASAQVVPGGGTNIELTGRIIGPVPMRPGVDSRFELTVRNLGPRPVATQVLMQAPWPFDGPRVSILPTAHPAPPCLAGTDPGGDPPIDYYLLVAIASGIPVGGAITCEFTLTVDRPLPEDAALTFTAYQDFDLTTVFDPDFSNNRFTFGLGQPLVVSIPSMTRSGWLALACALVAIASWRRHRATHDARRRSARP